MDFSTIKTNLESLGYVVSIFENSIQAVEYLDDQIDKKTVGFGGSVTLEQIGLYDKLSAHNRVSWHHRLAEGQKSSEVRLKANAAQIYISSVNGIAQTGEIVNIDGNCNRISAICYGHEKVYLVIGKNKIAKDFEGALYRARNIAAPRNAYRVKAKTPCAVKADKCYNCRSPQRICRVLTVWWQVPLTGEFEVILIDEDLGY